MSTRSPIPLSSKLTGTNATGFAFRQSSEPNYSFEWHEHDCAMLLWAQIGSMDSRWEGVNHLGGTYSHSLRLVRRIALLLPARTAHSTRSGAARQRHGELYIRPELLGARTSWGAFRLDDASLAMLGAVAAPALVTAGAEPLFHALLAQLHAGSSVQWLSGDMSFESSAPLSQQLLHRFHDALDQELSPPSVETVAEAMGISIRRIQRACASELGVSPVTLRRRLVAARARELLALGLAPAQAAQRLGFTHSGHLNRLLHEIPG